MCSEKFSSIKDNNFLSWEKNKNSIFLNTGIHYYKSGSTFLLYYFFFQFYVIIKKTAGKFIKLPPWG
jgi:hypothetical protein